jgi:hypothetical protein
MAGIQKRRKRSPIGVPGSVWVNMAFSSALSIAVFPFNLEFGGELISGAYTPGQYLCPFF